MKSCVVCGTSFAPERYDQIYCSPKCKERMKKRQQRLKRQKAGRCPQCGGPMDYPVRVGPGKAAGKQKISYCSRCREKFRERKVGSEEGQQ